MRILITFLLLIITIIGLFVFKSFAKRNSAIWIVAVIGFIAAYISAWFWRSILPIELDLFLQSQLIAILPKVSITPTNWVFTLTLIGTTITVLLSLPSKDLPQGHFYYWIATPLTLILALLAANAGNLTLIILALGAMDLLETVSLIRSGHFTKNRENYPLINLTLQTFGLFLITFAAIHSDINSNDMSKAMVTEPNSVYLILGFFFRSKIFQVSIDRASEPEEDQDHHWLGLLNMIKMGALIFMVSLMPPFTASIGFTIALEITFLVFGGYFSWLWVTSQGTLFSIHYLMISGSMIALYNALIGAPASAVPIAILVLFFSGMLSQHSHKTRRRSIYLAALSLLGLALPFTFTTSLWQPAHLQSFLTLPLIILIYLFVLLGYVRHVFEDVGVADRGSDGWGRVVSPITLGMLPITLILFGFMGWEGSASMGAPFIYIPLSILYLLTLVLVFRFRVVLQVLINARIPFIGNILSVFSTVLGKAVRALFELTKSFTTTITSLMEGEGSLLWTILILLVLLLITRGGS